MHKIIAEMSSGPYTEIMISKSNSLRRATVDLPCEVWEAAEAAVRKGAARSRNALVAQALIRYLRDLEEAEIDAQFAQMQDDPSYCRLMEQVAEEFSGSDWEAWRSAEASREYQA